jgi:hypothetical protein
MSHRPVLRGLDDSHCRLPQELAYPPDHAVIVIAHEPTMTGHARRAAYHPSGR